jgi:hypothetical protein
MTVFVIFADSLAGTDLSRYREYSFEMNLPAVASQTKVAVSESTTVHQRPALLQDLRWRLEHFSGSSDTKDPVNEILFSFYNGQLFRMVALYDRQKTKGLKTADVIEAIFGNLRNRDYSYCRYHFAFEIQGTLQSPGTMGGLGLLL